MIPETKPQRDRLKPPSRDVSDFFFEQRLYDFTNKNLPSHATEDMKKYMDDNMEAKEKVGAMLLAFEYFNSIAEIKLDYNKDEFLTNKKTWIQWLRAKTKMLVFSLLTLFICLALLVNLQDIIKYFESF
jgi:hypothetical protein